MPIFAINTLDHDNTPSATCDLSGNPEHRFYSLSNGRSVHNLPYPKRLGYSVLTRFWHVILKAGMILGPVEDFYIDVAGGNWSPIVDAYSPKYDDPEVDLPMFAIGTRKRQDRWGEARSTTHIKLWGMHVMIENTPPCFFRDK